MNILKFVESFCENNTIQFLSVDDNKIQYPNSNIYCTGFFTLRNNIPILGIANKAPKFDFILTHEFCHLQQWLDDSPYWNKSFLTQDEQKKFKTDKTEVIEMIDFWCESKIELDSNILNDFINRSILVELDCERRTLQLAPRFIDNFDKTDYIKNSNSYLRFYKYVELHRKWYLSGNPPYNDAIVVQSQLDTLDQDYLAPLSVQEEHIFNEYFERNK